jgi:hypothetical protein
MEKDLEVHATKHSDCGEQIEITLQTNRTAFTSGIQLLVAVPASFLLAVPREEHVNIHQLPLLACLIAWRVLWNRERHADANSVAGREGRRKVYAAPSVIHVPGVNLEDELSAIRIKHLLSSIISVHAETATLPTG